MIAELCEEDEGSEDEEKGDWAKIVTKNLKMKNNKSRRNPLMPISPKVISRTNVDEVRIPQTIESERFNAVQAEGEWEEIE